MTKIFLVADEQKFYDKSEMTPQYFSSLEGVTTKTFQELKDNPEVVATGAPVLFTFPYSLWGEFVEKPENGLYGSRGQGKAIRKLADFMIEFFEKRFPGAFFVNKPDSFVLERDKNLLNSKLSKAGFPTPVSLSKNYGVLLDEVKKGNTVFIKVNYGTNGQGITYMSPSEWRTNFDFENNEIKGYEGMIWKQKDITGNENFIKKLLDEEVVIERAIVNPAINGLKFDFRVRAYFGIAEENESYGRVSNVSAITNISQGARGVTVSEFHDLTNNRLKNSIKYSLDLISEAAVYLGLNNAGGDILFQGKDFKPVFLEINSYPGISLKTLKKLTPSYLNKLHSKLIEKFNLNINSNERPYTKSRI